jgi:hypothetical protein
VIVTTQPFQTLDADVFLLHGIDVTRCSAVGLKSSQHFRAGFRHLAGAILTADAPGLTTNQVEAFDHPSAGRPLWPGQLSSVYKHSNPRDSRRPRHRADVMPGAAPWYWAPSPANRPTSDDRPRRARAHHAQDRTTASDRTGRQMPHARMPPIVGDPPGCRAAKVPMEGHDTMMGSGSPRWPEGERESRGVLRRWEFLPTPTIREGATQLAMRDDRRATGSPRVLGHPCASLGQQIAESVARSVCGPVRTTTVSSRCDQGADEKGRRQSSEYGPAANAPRASRGGNEMRPLRYSINVTLDGCCHHEAGLPPDEESMRYWTAEMQRADALLFGRVTYEMMESAWRQPATGTWPDWMDEWEIPFAETIDRAKKYVVWSPVLSDVFGRTPDTYQQAGLRRGTATSNSTLAGTTSP